jgi:NAD(P)-dependent dehydrogenase (short-subunit alcohol dehydrogenase family)
MPASEATLAAPSLPRRAVVTGGGKGIGLACAQHLAAVGHHVVVVGRDERALADSGFEFRVCDVTDEQAVVDAAASIGAIDILVNNAGGATSAPVHRTTLADWNHIMAVNATGPFLWTRAVLPGMRQRNWGRIVTVASITSHRGAPYVAAYAASKHAVLGFMRVVSAEVAGTHITANSVCPAYVRSEMTDRTIANIMERTGRTAEDAEKSLVGIGGLDRLVEPDEVAAAVAYFCSPGAGAVNGQSLILDGGIIQS